MEAERWKHNPEIIATKNTHAKSQRIAVKVSKNKHDVKVAMNSKSKKIAIQVSI